MQGGESCGGSRPQPLGWSVSYLQIHGPRSLTAVHREDRKPPTALFCHGEPNAYHQPAHQLLQNKLPGDVERLSSKIKTPTGTAKKRALVRVDDASVPAEKLTVLPEPSSFDLTIVQKIYLESLIGDSTASLVYNRAGGKPKAEVHVLRSEGSMLRDDVL